MKEKILALLLAKFAGVRKDGLARLAQALSLQAENETEAGVLVEKLTTEKVNDFVTDYRKDVDKEVSEGVKTNEKTLKEKFDLIEKKSPAQPKPGEDPKPGEEMPAWAKALVESNNDLKTKLSAFENGKTTETRLQTLEGKLTNVPEAFKAKALKDFKRMNFENDEAFNEYLTDMETDVTALNQELADGKLAGGTKPIFGSKGADGVSSAVAAYIADKTNQAKPLEGKPV